ncbi:MAG: DUF72 domain-containing protein [Bacillota bacterium]|nr:DUF72 domain-containing protein [Bacillota bacterium]
MVYAGTCGYSYKDWIGPYYPSGTKDSQMLEFYSSDFDFVEVNSSFYHMPRLQLFDSISRKTGENFKVAVKLFQGFTHTRDLEKESAEGFKSSLAPLIETQKLVCLLAQFPYSFHFSEINMEYLKRLREWFSGININVEFRNQGWIKEQVIKFLKVEGLGFVCVDEPQVRGLIRNVTALTSEVAYLRLHGRNAEKWYGGNGPERYDYLYSSQELEEWIPKIEKMDNSAALTIISFNNHPQGKAIANTKMMLELLKKAE